MGAERDDAAAAKPRRSGTDPGLGGIPAGSGHGPAAEPIGHDEPEAVDFDALHAALGDPLALDELPDGDYHDARHHGGAEPDDEGGIASVEDDEPSAEDDYSDGSEPHVGESQGRSSAQYASSRPHTIPPSHISSEDMNAPPVIVASEDIGATVPSGPPQQMTKPIHQTRPIALTPLSGVPFVSPSAHSSGPYPAAAVAPYQEAAPFADALPPPAYPRGAAQMTVRMPDRPISPPANPRRGKVQTLVVRPRGPSTKQKLFAFMAMLLLVTACGIVMIIWRKPGWVGLEAPAASSAPTASSAPAAPALSVAPTGDGTTTAPPSTTSTAPVTPSASAAPSASASVKPKPKPAAPPATSSH